MKWKITYYNETLFKEIRQLPPKLKARYIVLTERMGIDGPNLGMPHTKALDDGLCELRIKAKEGIARVFYCAIVEKEILMLHSFIKKTDKIPKKELRIATDRLKIERGKAV